MGGLTGSHGKRASLAVRTVEGNPATVVLSGEIDLSTVNQVEAAVNPLLVDGPSKLVFDLSGITFMDSSALGALVMAAQQVPQVLIRNPSPSARRIIELTGLTYILQFDHPVHYTKHLLQRVESIAEARAFAHDALSHLSPDLVDDVVLRVSELATNAIVHARTAADLVIDLDSERVRVSITDHGGGEPKALSPSELDTHGRGLRIVEALSDEWGVRRSPGSTEVWFVSKIS